MLCTDSAPVLTPQLLLAAYRRGFFPMADEAGMIQWHDPDPRAVFPLATTRPNARLRRLLRKSGFTITMDQAVEEVITNCATVHGDSWITPAIMHACSALHQQGHALSVETWRGHRLVGGIYGVAIGAAFFGESMFSLETNASKAAFFHLAEHLRQHDFRLFDTQYLNDHTASLGAVEIPRNRFMMELGSAVSSPCSI